MTTSDKVWILRETKQENIKISLYKNCDAALTSIMKTINDYLEQKALIANPEFTPLVNELKNNDGLRVLDLWNKVVKPKLNESLNFHLEPQVVNE